MTLEAYARNLKNAYVQMCDMNAQYFKIPVIANKTLETNRNAAINKYNVAKNELITFIQEYYK